MMPHLPDPPLVPTPIQPEVRHDPLLHIRRTLELTTLQELTTKLTLALGVLLIVVGAFIIIRTMTDWFGFVFAIFAITWGAYLALAAHRKLQYHTGIRLATYVAGLLRDFPPGPRP